MLENDGTPDEQELENNILWDEVDPILGEIPEDEILEIDELINVQPNIGGYTSPLMARLSTTRLTLEMLATEIPILQAGEEARAILAEGVKGVKRKAELQKISNAGEGAKERLFAAALPLIRTVAHREWKRRQQWGSQVGLEDLTQEAILGFFKGLISFKPEAVRTSPTNYLGQWMLVGMRRAAEVMDHDLQVGHDAGERFRRVRAIRSRLLSDLGREPTDKEIADASRNPQYLTRPGMVGRAPINGEGHVVGKGLSLSNITEERGARTRVGHAARFATSDNEESNNTGNVVDSERLIGADSSNLGIATDPAELAVESAGAKEVAKLVEKVINLMKMPEEQKEIIARRYGLHPHEDEASAREISRIMGIHRERVTRVLSAFTTEITRKGGIFHETVSTIASDDLMSIGLGWVVTSLGPWDPSQKDHGHIATVLTDIMKVSIPLEERSTGSTKSVGVLAWFQCDYHDRIFSGLYPDVRTVPKSRACPACQRASGLVRIGNLSDNGKQNQIDTEPKEVKDTKKTKRR